MKTRFFQKLLTVVLCLTLAVSAAACGGNTDGNAGTNVENSGGNQVESTDSGNSGSGSFADVVASVASDVKEAAAGAPPVTIYLVGSDTIAFYVKSDACYKLKSNDTSKSSDWQLCLRTEDYYNQAQFQEYSSYCWWHEHEGDEGKHASSDYDSNILTDDSCFTVISSPGICDSMKWQGELTLTADNGMEDKHEDLGKFDASAVVKKLSLEEFADAVAEVLGLGAPECAWSGLYKTDSYGDVKGFMNVSVTENGGIVVKANMDGEEKTYVGYEYHPEDWGPDGEEIMRQLKLLNPPANEENISRRASFQYYKRVGDSDWYGDEGISWTYDEWRNDGGNNYKSATFYRYKEKHVAPEDYKDEDFNGLLARKDTNDDQFFKPDSDDYIINCMTNYEVGENGYLCDAYYLYSYDVNGIMMYDYKTKYVFKEEADAKAFTEKFKKDNGSYYNVDLFGNVLYYSYKRDPKDTYRQTDPKFQFFSSYGSNWYANCHYVYGSKRDDGSYYNVAYVSKPYTEKEYKMSLEDLLFWESIPRGDHRSLETKDALLTLDIGDYNNVYFYGQIDGVYADNPSELHIVGQNIVGCGLTRRWADNEVNYWISFTEINCTKEVADVTQYSFKLTDPYDTGINFDNYKTKTPDTTLTQKYDLTRGETNY